MIFKGDIMFIRFFIVVIWSLSITIFNGCGYTLVKKESNKSVETAQEITIREKSENDAEQKPEASHVMIDMVGFKMEDFFITPSNHPKEWTYYGRWDNEGLIEQKMPSGAYYKRIIIDENNKDIGKLLWVLSTLTRRSEFEYKYYMYAQGKSMVKYDISGKKYFRFEGQASLLPLRACGHHGTVEFIFYVDRKVLFRTGVIRGIEQKNPIYVVFDIPQDSQTLTIEVSNGGDDVGCDHWVLGDAKLFYIKVN